MILNSSVQIRKLLTRVNGNVIRKQKASFAEPAQSDQIYFSILHIRDLAEKKKIYLKESIKFRCIYEMCLDDWGGKICVTLEKQSI